MQRLSRSPVLHVFWEGRAFGPSLFFGAALLLLAAALLAGDGYRWGAIALLVVAASANKARLPKNELTLFVVLFAFWYCVDATWISPNYTSEAIYRPLVLLAAFVGMATMEPDRRVALFRAGVALLCGLVLLGLAQHLFAFWHLTRNGLRAAATFVTPNTFATVINLLLLPLAALYLLRGAARGAYAPALWLFAGLSATGSRGGMLALAFGLAFLCASLGIKGALEIRWRIFRLLAGFALAWVAVSVALAVLGGTPEVQAVTSAWTDPGSVAERFRIYAVALEIALRKPLLGAGTGMFFNLWEAAKPDFMYDRVFSFVHNDYLQVWLELGVPGAMLLLGIVGAAARLAWRAGRRARDEATIPACGAALAACFAHAVVDFPLYVPFVLLLVGGYLGALASGAGDRVELRRISTALSIRSGAVVTPLTKGIAVFAALAWLGQPTFAAAAGLVGLSSLKEGQPGRAAYWYSVARRLEPRNGAFYWVEGIIWRDQAAQLRDPGLMHRADAFFEEGMRASPYEKRNFTERARLHMTHRDLLERPASGSEIIAWTSWAMQIEPNFLPNQVAHARALGFAGRRDDARRLVETMFVRHPESELVKRLKAEL